MSTPVAMRSNLGALLVLSVNVAAAFAMQLVFSPVQELAKHELALSDFQLGLVQGLAASIPVALLSIPIGRLVDRGNRVRLLLGLAIVWTLGTVLTAFAQGFGTLFIARMLGVTGAMCSLPVAISLAADLSSPQTRGRALLVLSLGRIIGASAAFVLAGALLVSLASFDALTPWRAVHLAFAVTSVLLMLPLLLLKEPARQETGEAANVALGPALRAIWARRAFLAPLFLGQVTVVMADGAAAIWAPPVLTRDYGLTPGQFGGWMGGIVLLSGILGSVLGGLAADWGHSGRIRGGILVGAVVASVVSIPGAFFPLMPSVAGFGWMLALLLTAGSITGLVTTTAIAVVVPNDVRGVCLGAFIVVAAIVGLGAAPTLVTVVSSLLGGEQHLAKGLTVVTLTTSVVSAIGFVAAARRRS